MIAIIGAVPVNITDIESRNGDQSLPHLVGQGHNQCTDRPNGSTYNPKCNICYLVIMDLMMHRDNGFDVIKKIRSTTYKYYLPVFILSAKSDLDDAIKGFQVGADDYITKPINPRELIRRLNALFRREKKKQIERKACITN